MSKKVAFAVDDNMGLQSTISQHFGRCAYFVVVDFSSGDEISFDIHPNTSAQNHNPGDVPNLIRSFGASTIVSGGMGHRARQFFEQMGIQSVVGAQGTVEQVIQQMRDGTFVVPDVNLCDGEKEHKH